MHQGITIPSVFEIKVTLGKLQKTLAFSTERRLVEDTTILLLVAR